MSDDREAARKASRKLLAAVGSWPKVGDVLPDGSLVADVTELPGQKVRIARFGDTPVVWRLRDGEGRP